MKPIIPTAAFAADPKGLAELKRAAAAGQPSETTLKQVASQFEALFVQMMLKSMREASFGDDLFGDEQTEFYRDMYDQQLAVLLARQQGMGLQDMLVRQLGGGRVAVDGLPPGLEAMLNQAGLKASVAAGDRRAPREPANFVQQLWPHAERAGRELGVEPQAIVSIAALETGWGGAIIRHPDGRSAHNLFGIKAGEAWDGQTVTAVTREVINGRSVERRERFRAYDSVADSVADFAHFLKSNPRYQAALGAGSDARGFFAALAAAGYATDPGYAGKLDAVRHGAILGEAMAALKISGDRSITT